MNRNYHRNTVDNQSQERLIQSVKECVSKIKEALIEESWLPLGLRTIVGSELKELDSLVNQGVDAINSLAHQAHHLAFNVFSYKGLHEKSETIQQIMVLDLLIQDHLQPLRDESKFTALQERQEYQKAG